MDSRGDVAWHIDHMYDEKTLSSGGKLNWLKRKKKFCSSFYNSVIDILHEVQTLVWVVKVQQKKINYYIKIYFCTGDIRILGCG